MILLIKLYFKIDTLNFIFSFILII